MPTQVVYPLTDVTTQWNTTTGANHFGEIDEGTGSPNDTDYIETTDVSDVDEFTLGDSPANTDQVTQVVLSIRAKITDTGGTKVIRAELFHSSGTPVTGNPKDITVAELGGSGVLATVTETWSGLTLTKAQADSLQLRLTFQ